MAKMASKRKPAIRESRVVHVCTQAENIKKLNEILVGNGHPEDGLAFRFNLFMEDHKRVLKDIGDIKAKVSEAIKASGTAARAIEEYKKQELDISEGKDAIIKLAEKTRKEKMEKTRTTLQVIATIIGVLMFILAYLNIMKQSVNNGAKIDNLGTPVVTNARGQVTPLPNGDSIKYFTKEGWVSRDTVKK